MTIMNLYYCRNAVFAKLASSQTTRIDSRITVNPNTDKRNAQVNLGVSVFLNINTTETILVNSNKIYHIVLVQKVEFMS
jgi:hypothetical protein